VWRVVASLLGAVLALWTHVAWANPPSVHLEVEACDSLDATSITRIFAADLGTPLTAQVGPDVTEVNIGCEGERVVVRVKDPLSRKTVRRSFDPKSFGNQGQSRLIAIAASELVLASWAELAANPTPQVLGEGEPVSPDTLETARKVVKARAKTAPPPLMHEADDNPFDADERQNPYRLELTRPDAPPHEPPAPKPVLFQRVTAVISVRSFLTSDGALFGGGARFGQDRFGVVSWAADALVEGGTLKGDRITSTSLGGSVSFYLHRGPATFRLGGGLRAGIVNFDTGASLAAWGWPMLVTSITLRWGPAVLEVGGETGLVDVLVHHNQGLRGVWLSGQAGLGLVL
jgi:hypothetical protein